MAKRIHQAWWLWGLLLMGACAPTPTALPEAAPTLAAVQGALSTTTAAAPTLTPLPATATPALLAATAVASATPAMSPSPTATLTPTSAPTAIPAAAQFGRTAEGVYARGAPDAPVTVIDYSDFL